METGRGRRGTMLVFLFYLGLMLWLLFFRQPYETDALGYWETVGGNLNLRPFETVRRLFLCIQNGSAALRRFAWINLLGNVLLFVPPGFFLPRLFPGLRRLWRTLLVSAAVIAAVECIQLFALVGSCDVDDLLLNLLGIALGYPVFWLWRKRRRE